MDKLNEELKEIREALDEKSKKLAERTEGAAKYDAFNTGMLLVSIFVKSFHKQTPPIQ